MMRSLARHLRSVHEIVLPWQTLSGVAWLFAGICITPGPVRWTDWTLYMVVLAVVLARTSGMVWNRWFDRHFDGENPRTAHRPLQSGRISPNLAVGYALVTLALFLLTCISFSATGRCIGLFVAIAVVVYSLLKRVSSCCHFFLGLIYGVLPLVGSVWLSHEVAPAVWALSLAAATSIAGTDILYATQDENPDRRLGLYSLPVTLGSKKACHIAAQLHLMASVAIMAALFSSHASMASMAVGMAAFTILWVKWNPLAFPFFLLFFPITACVTTGVDRLCRALS